MAAGKGLFMNIGMALAAWTLVWSCVVWGVGALPSAAPDRRSVTSAVAVVTDSPLPPDAMAEASTGVQHAIAALLEIDSASVTVSTPSQHRRAQTQSVAGTAGASSLTFNYMIACDSSLQRAQGDCGSIESALRQMSTNPDVARVQAQAIIDAVAAASASVGYIGAVVSSVDDVVATFSVPATVQLNLAFAGSGVYSTNCDVSQMVRPPPTVGFVVCLPLSRSNSADGWFCADQPGSAPGCDRFIGHNC